VRREPGAWRAELPRRSGPMRSAALRRDGATGECELRTRFAGLSLAKYRGAPPRTCFGPRRTRDFSDLAEAAAEQRRFRRLSRPPRSPTEPSAAPHSKTARRRSPGASCRCSP
jgi:hypothetical protein